jgi:hypothetical protein
MVAGELEKEIIKHEHQDEDEDEGQLGAMIEAWYQK